MSKDADRVREYKQNSCFKINGLNYARIIATRVYDCSIKNTCKEIIKMLFYKYEFEIDARCKSKIIFLYTYRNKKRKDFDYIFDNAVMFAKNANVGIDICEGNFVFSINNVNRLVLFLKYCILFVKSKLKHPVFAACLVSQFIEYEDVFRNILENKKYTACISFCDAHGVENQFVQMALLCGIKTATLQHGQYRILKKQTENADVEAYENFISDYLFAWGKKTKEEFVRANIAPERVILTGAIKPFSYNTPLVPKQRKNVFGVVLSGNVYDESNINMIALANRISEKYQMKYVLRMHPKNNEEYYIAQCNEQYLSSAMKSVENYEYAEMVDFSILHMTGVFVELLSINSPIFVFEDVYMEDIFKLEDATFSNIKDFERVYNLFLSDRDSFLSKQYGCYKDYNYCENIEEQYIESYKRFLLEL